VIKTVLAIRNHPDRRKEPYHIVSVIRNMKNMDVARVVGKDEVEWIGSGDVISRIIAQTSRQVGLSAVYTELLDFRGNEIYFHWDPSLENKTFGEILNAYDNETVIGIYSADSMVKLNPSMKKVIKQGDKMILIAPDDTQIAVQGGMERHIDRRLIVTGKRNGHKAEKTLMLGWNWRAHAILHELDHYVPAGSEVQVVADMADVAAEIEQGCQDLKNQRVCVRFGDTSDRGLLERLDFEDYDHVILLSYSDRLSQQQADAHTLITLLHVRDIAQKYDYNFSIVTEMLDVRNRRLASVTKVDDFIVSDRLVSLLMAQISENKELNRVFADLFDTGGSELYLKPIDQYVRVGRPVNFYTLVEAARKRSEVAVGYRLNAFAADYVHGFGICLNPAKSESITFHPEDRVIVLARD
jgi:ion channel POLLUX/CASTOR